MDVTDADTEHFSGDRDFFIEQKDETKTLVLNILYEVISYNACSNEGNDISLHIRLHMIKIMSV